MLATHAPRIKSAFITLVIACTLSGCRDISSSPSATSAQPLAYTSIGVWSNNMYGGMFSNGLLVLHYASGSVSICQSTCAAIGKVEPGPAADLVLTNTPGGGVYITNVRSGRVFLCTPETDGWGKVTKGGECKDLGAASQTATAARPSQTAPVGQDPSMPNASGDAPSQSNEPEQSSGTN